MKQISSLLILLSLLFLPVSALALSPTDQDCSEVANSPTYSWLGSGHEMYQFFVPAKNMLDAITVRVRTEIGESSNLELTLIRERDGGGSETVLTLNQTIDRTEKWVLFDFDDIPAFPNKLYGLKLKTTDEHAHGVWKNAGNNCYDRGLAVMDGVARTDLDFGFATYGYDAAPDASTPASAAPASQTQAPNASDDTRSYDQNNTSGETTNEELPKTTGGLSSAKKSPIKATTSSSVMSKEEAERIVKDLSKTESDTPPLQTFLYFLIAAIPALLVGFLLFLGLLGLILFLIIRKRRHQTSEQPKAVIAPQTNQTLKRSVPPEAKPSSKKGKAPLVLLIVLLVAAVFVVLIIAGLFGYKKLRNSKQPSVSQTVSVTPTSVISKGQVLPDDSEFGPILREVVGEVRLKYNTEILDGKHFFYIPSRDVTSADYDKIKDLLIKKGYQDFRDGKFDGKNSITLLKDNNFIHIAKKVKFISIAVVGKVADLKNRAD